MMAKRIVGFLLLLVPLGCGKEPEKPLAITGTVTYQSEPVAEGMVQFVDDTTGRGAEIELKPDGSYQVELMPGTYAVLVSPPYLVDTKGGIPNPMFKKVKNIPPKYHSTATSGLKVTVNAENTRHNLTLSP